uniref:Secreted protein n=1 Tax=Brassica oleracea TaxID=3712 RepID=A0A3P6CXG2_BRAOL|nr:unnamed protein product [Brassica oleracea]
MLLSTLCRILLQVLWFLLLKLVSSCCPSRALILGIVSSLLEWMLTCSSRLSVSHREIFSPHIGLSMLSMKL